MRKYELSMSADYVPDWGTTEAVREFFQNALDEETRDSSNKMFFEYDKDEETIRIGNRHSELEIITLLFGTTTKKDNADMIGSHGEGYKIATTVLLRLGKTVVFQNYCRKEIWRPRLVKSRKYNGALVPTFFVEQVPVWEQIPEHNLIIEIGGISLEEYEAIKKANLRLQDEESERGRETSYGRILEAEQHKGKVYVSGLYICSESGLDIGIDFHPNIVRIERDRSMVNSFDIKWYAARMVEELKDSGLTKRSLDHYSGIYINASNVDDEIKNEIAEDFINQYGTMAVPVINQTDMENMKKKGYKPVIVSEARKSVILEADFYEDVRDTLKREKEETRPIYERFCEFAEKIEDRLTEDEVITLYGFADELENIEQKQEEDV